MLLTAFCVCSTGYVMQIFESYSKWDWHRIATVGFANTSGFPYTYHPRTTAHRIFYGSCLISALIYSVVIGTYMIPLLASPIYEDQVNSVHEITANDYDLVGDPFCFLHMQQQNEVNYVKSLNNLTAVHL